MRVIWELQWSSENHFKPINCNDELEKVIGKTIALQIFPFVCCKDVLLYSKESQLVFKNLINNHDSTSSRSNPINEILVLKKAKLILWFWKVDCYNSSNQNKVFNIDYSNEHSKISCLYIFYNIGSWNLTESVIIKNELLL